MSYYDRDHPRMPVSSAAREQPAGPRYSSRRPEVHQYPPSPMSPISPAFNTHHIEYEERSRWGTPSRPPIFPSSQPTRPWLPSPHITGPIHRDNSLSWPGFPGGIPAIPIFNSSPERANPWSAPALPSLRSSSNPRGADGFKHQEPLPLAHSPAAEQAREKRGSHSRRSQDSSYAGTDQSGGSMRKPASKRRSSHRDEFDGPHQYLDKLTRDVPHFQEEDLPTLPTSLLVSEQDELLNKVNDCLSLCAFNFMAKFQFPIPLEADKRPVTAPADREWNEWVFLLKRLATKRRIPARVLYNGQIKQLVTVLESSLEMRHAAMHQSRPIKDDRNILQLISAGTQVAKILKDAPAMVYLDQLYRDTERLISDRNARPVVEAQDQLPFLGQEQKRSPSK